MRDIFRRIGSKTADGRLSSDIPENDQPKTGSFRETEVGAPLKVVFGREILHLQMFQYKLVYGCDIKLSRMDKPFLTNQYSILYMYLEFC
jgi:hypothetical protein